MMANDNSNATKFDIVFVDDEIATTNVFNSFFNIIYTDNTSKVYNNPLLVADDLRANKLQAKVWLIDVMMNGLNGVELALLIREKFGKTAKIFAYSALEKEVLYNKFPKAGVFDGFYNRIVTLTDVIEEIIKEADELPPFEEEEDKKELSVVTLPAAPAKEEPVTSPPISPSAENKPDAVTPPTGESPALIEPVMHSQPPVSVVKPTPPPVITPTPPATMPAAVVKPVSGFAPVKKPVTMPFPSTEVKSPAEQPQTPSEPPKTVSTSSSPLPPPKTPIEVPQQPLKDSSPLPAEKNQTVQPPAASEPALAKPIQPPAESKPVVAPAMTVKPVTPPSTVAAKPAPPTTPTKVIIPAANGKSLTSVAKPQTTTPTTISSENGKSVKIALPITDKVIEKPGIFRQFVKEPVRYVLPGVDFEKIRQEKTKQSPPVIKTENRLPQPAPVVPPPSKVQPKIQPAPPVIQPYNGDFQIESPTDELDWGEPVIESPYKMNQPIEPKQQANSFSIAYQQPEDPNVSAALPPKKKKKKKSSGGISKPLVIVLVILLLVFLLILAFYLIPEENFKGIPFLYNFLKSIPSSF